MYRLHPHLNNLREEEGQTGAQVINIFSYKYCLIAHSLNGWTSTHGDSTDPTPGIYSRSKHLRYLVGRHTFGPCSCHVRAAAGRRSDVHWTGRLISNLSAMDSVAAIRNPLLDFPDGRLEVERQELLWETLEALFIFGRFCWYQTPSPTWSYARRPIGNQQPSPLPHA